MLDFLAMIFLVGLEPQMNDHLPVYPPSQQPRYLPILTVVIM
jgi:hypothetical protein